MPYGTVNADVIQSSVGGVSLGAGNASIMKNRIINGAMMIDQRNAGASVTPAASGYTLDRWALSVSQASKLTVQQNYGSLSGANLPDGFTNYLGVFTASAFSIGSGDYFQLSQSIEGFNVADLKWGTANAKTVTLSFQVYSSLTGTFGGSLRNSASNRSYPFTYSIPTANTWTTISVTVAGDTSGTWVTNNGVGLTVSFGLGVGSTYSGTAGSWAGAFYISATGATSVVGTNGATFYITGVQLEVGSVATGYEYRQYQQELALCQRYYYRIGYNSGANFGNRFGAGYTEGTTLGVCLVPFGTPMRVNPTGAYSAAGDWTVTNTTTYTASAISILGNYNQGIVTLTCSGLTANQSVQLRNGNTSAWIDFSAEL